MKKYQVSVTMHEGRQVIACLYKAMDPFTIVERICDDGEKIRVEDNRILYIRNGEPEEEVILTPMTESEFKETCGEKYCQECPDGRILATKVIEQAFNFLLGNN